jgi:hypothetical protein
MIGTTLNKLAHQRMYASIAALALGLALIACLAPASRAGTVAGTVRNGTSGKVAAGVEMILIQLQGGMQPVANTKTDAAGHYSFDNPALGTAPMLIRAVYQGVNYHEPVTPGQATADVEVFEPTDKASAFSVTAHAIVVQPSASGLTIGEEYNISNKTQPPVAYFRADGSFVFSLPDGAQLDNVSAAGSAGMPVIQSTIDKGKNKSAIAFPFRPGDNDVRISYKLPYPGNQTQIHIISPYAVDRLAVFAPPSMQISGDGFVAAGQTQGFNVYMRQTVAANTPMTVSISGTAPVATDQDSGAAGSGSDSGTNSGASPGDDSQNPSVNSRADTGNAAATATATAMPARLDSLKWVIVAGFGALFALGLIYLWQRPEMALAGAAGEPRAAVSETLPAPLMHAMPLPATASAVQTAVADVNREVRGSLDELKDVLFRLELRRQAGTISEEEYAREHDRVEKTLRDLVKG